MRTENISHGTAPTAAAIEPRSSPFGVTQDRISRDWTVGSGLFFRRRLSFQKIAPEVALITFLVRGEPTDFVFETIAFNILGTKSVLVPRGTVALPVIRSLSRRPSALQWPSLALCPLRVCHCTAQIVQIGVVRHRCIAESSGMMHRGGIDRCQG